MRSLIILLAIFSATANASVYKCKDANGNTSYSKTKCIYQDKAGEEINVENKQPVVTEEEKFMREKDNIAMQEIISDFKAKKRARLDLRDRMFAEDQANQERSKKNSAYNKSKREYHQAKIDKLENKKSRMRTYQARRAVDDLIDAQEKLKRKYK